MIQSSERVVFYVAQVEQTKRALNLCLLQKKKCQKVVRKIGKKKAGGYFDFDIENEITPGPYNSNTHFYIVTRDKLQTQKSLLRGKIQGYTFR